MPLQEHPPTVNTHSSNNKNFLSHTDINQAITLIYNFSSQQSSASSSASIWQITRIWKHRQDETPNVTIILGIHKPDRRSRMDMDEEKKSQDGSDRNDGSNNDEEENDFSRTTTIPLMKSITMIRMELLKIGNINMSHMTWNFLIN